MLSYFQKWGIFLLKTFAGIENISYLCIVMIREKGVKILQTFGSFGRYHRSQRGQRTARRADASEDSAVITENIGNARQTGTGSERTTGINQNTPEKEDFRPLGRAGRFPLRAQINLKTESNG